ncbi:hypothetical protein TRFO_04961 [Tritrichomonas foetus]|uniref:Uncharacterized protein n=1 Tax=Tritrichomonas foetus TaxID=1144522 RepID=A0A1J4KA73_9EUKA|nr:hypothetical protein TRFO_04961 [Tritrichomonas foetus]|eukprot:OHT08337.1 hypothetical protein TRFO_04961 [Tritrichomonas foetus]
MNNSPTFSQRLQQFHEKLNDAYSKELNKSTPDDIWNLEIGPSKCRHYTTFTQFLRKKVKQHPIWFPENTDVLSSIFSSFFQSRQTFSIILILNNWTLLSDLLASFRRYQISDKVLINYEISRYDNVSFPVCRERDTIAEKDFLSNTGCIFCAHYKTANYIQKNCFDYTILENKSPSDIEDLFFNSPSCPVDRFHRYNQYINKKEKNQTKSRSKITITTSKSFANLVFKRSLFYGFDFEKMFQNERIILFGNVIQNNFFIDQFISSIDTEKSQQTIEDIQKTLSHQSVLHSFLDIIKPYTEILSDICKLEHEKNLSLSDFYPYRMTIFNENSQFNLKSEEELLQLPNFLDLLALLSENNPNNYFHIFKQVLEPEKLHALLNPEIQQMVSSIIYLFLPSYQKKINDILNLINLLYLIKKRGMINQVIWQDFCCPEFQSNLKNLLQFFPVKEPNIEIPTTQQKLLDFLQSFSSAIIKGDKWQENELLINNILHIFGPNSNSQNILRQIFSMINPDYISKIQDDDIQQKILTLLYFINSSYHKQIIRGINLINLFFHYQNNPTILEQKCPSNYSEYDFEEFLKLIKKSSIKCTKILYNKQGIPLQSPHLHEDKNQLIRDVQNTILIQRKKFVDILSDPQKIFHSTSFENFYQSILSLNYDHQIALINILSGIALLNTDCIFAKLDSNYLQIRLPNNFDILSGQYPILWLKLTFFDKSNSIKDKYFNAYMSMFCSPENSYINLKSKIDENEPNQFGRNVIYLDYANMYGIRILSWYPEFYESSFKYDSEQHKFTKITSLYRYLTGSPGIGKSSIIPYILLRWKSEPFPRQTDYLSNINYLILLLRYYDKDQVDKEKGTIFFLRTNRIVIIGSAQIIEAQCLIFNPYQLYLIDSFTPIPLTNSNIFVFKHFGFEIDDKNYITLDLHNKEYFTIYDGNVSQQQSSRSFICNSYARRQTSSRDENATFAPTCTASEFISILKLTKRINLNKFMRNAVQLAKLINFNLRNVIGYAFDENSIMHIHEKMKSQSNDSIFLEVNVTKDSHFLNNIIKEKKLLFIISPPKPLETQNPYKYAIPTSYDAWLYMTNSYQGYSEHDKQNMIHILSALFVGPVEKGLGFENSAKVFLKESCIVLQCRKILKNDSDNSLFMSKLFSIMLNACTTIEDKAPNVIEICKSIRNNTANYYQPYDAPPGTLFYDHLLAHNKHLFIFQDTIAREHSFTSKYLKALLQQFQNSKTNDYYFKKATIIYLRQDPPSETINFIKPANHDNVLEIISTLPNVEILCSMVDSKETLKQRKNLLRLYCQQFCNTQLIDSELDDIRKSYHPDY